jgi:predicted aspartyl protease
MRLFAVLFVAALFAATLNAQTRDQVQCPANVTAIHFHTSNQHQMVVGVSINHSGPYDFLIDTGTQMTVVDRSLADELHLATSGNASVAGVSLQGDATYAHLDTLSLGDHASGNHGVLVYDMKNLQAAGFAIRGLLGEDFLSRFEVLIDNAHNVLCLDDTGAMAGAITPSR